jgi:hypothetical protein
MMKRTLLVALLITSSTVLLAPNAEAAPIPKRPIDYWVGLAPWQIWDGTIEYFREQGFTTVVLIAAESAPYDKELQKIRQLGMYPILDVERVIWQGKTTASIHSFHDAFAMWQRAGWTHVASEGGRDGDLDCMKYYFTKFTFFNCDRCGIWGNFHMHPLTTSVSWETFYEDEIPYIQQGARESYPLGKGQGILAGVWEPNNKCCRFETYKALLDWSYAANVGFTHFHVWFDLGPSLSDYKQLGLEQIVSQLQMYYPPKSAQPMPISAAAINSLTLVPSAPRYLKWEISNVGETHAWVSAHAGLYQPSSSPPYYNYYACAHPNYAFDLTENRWIPINYVDKWSWFLSMPGHRYLAFSGPVVPPDAKWSVGNLYKYVQANHQGWVYDQYDIAVRLR